MLPFLILRKILQETAWTTDIIAHTFYLIEYTHRTDAIAGAAEIKPLKRKMAVFSDRNKRSCTYSSCLPDASFFFFAFS